MIVYNVSLVVQTEIFDDFCNWMVTVHIPEIMSTGMFLKSLLLKTLAPQPDGMAALQISFYCKSMADYDHYITLHSEAMRNAFPAKYKGRYQTSRTVSELIFEF